MYVTPKDDCPHVDPNLLFNIEKFSNIDFKSLKCQDCEETKEIWLCLNCGFAFCSRYVNSHFFEHYRSNKGHSICASWMDLSFWCYECETPGFTDPGCYIDNKVIYRSNF